MYIYIYIYPTALGQHLCVWNHLKIGVTTLCMGWAYKHLDAMVGGALDFGFQSNI